jgi:uncharacterized protein (TIGR03435 family)
MRWVAAFSVFCGMLAGQTPAFETASLKPADPSQSRMDFLVLPGGRLRVMNQTLVEMVRQSYQLKGYQRVNGGPGWKDSERFDVEAKAPGNVSRDEVMAMLRTLLAERFQLQVRRGSHEGNVYDLVVAKGGPKLKASTAEAAYLRLYRNTPPELPGVSYTIGGQKVTIARLVDFLMGTVQRPVVDRTGISGEFDFKIDYAVEGHSEQGPSIFTALQEQLGLKLQAAKGMIESLTMERAERPTAN